MNGWLKLRASEWVLLAFFCYTALSALWIRADWRLVTEPLILAFAIPGFLLVVSRFSETSWRRGMSFFRDWLPIPLTYLAFREMEWFATPHYDVALESAWITLDQLILGAWHGRDIIESLGPLIPSYLELCYFLVYGLPAYGVMLLYLRHRRPAVDRFLTFYLLGTLTAYTLFPYFPSQPPRYAFPAVFPPRLLNPVHILNVKLLNAGTIHTGVFPSAHVSSALSAAWALFFLFPDRRRYGWIALAYAVSVSIATVYSRYHYATDVLGGLGISLIPAALAMLWFEHRPIVLPQAASALSTSARKDTLQGQ